MTGDTFKNVLLLAGVAVAAGWPIVVPAQQPYPSKPVRIISPFAPGGGNDAVCRIIAPRLTELLKHQVIIDSRPGANGIVGTEATAKSPPDGYTMALVPSGHSLNVSLYKKLPFDAIKDFTPIALVGSSPMILVVHPTLPVKNVKDLIALAKARPEQLTYGSAGVGASGHLAGAMFDVLAGTKMMHVPYKGMSPALVDLMGGQIFMTFGTSLSVVPQMRSGRVKALATTGAKRAAGFPEIPTIAESGVPGYEANLWYGFVGPARVPPDIVRRLNAEIGTVLKTPEVRDRLLSQGLEAQPSTPEEFGRLMATDVDRWAKVVERAGVKVE